MARGKIPIISMVLLTINELKEIATALMVCTSKLSSVLTFMISLRVQWSTHFDSMPVPPGQSYLYRGTPFNT